MKKTFYLFLLLFLFILPGCTIGHSHDYGQYKYDPLEHFQECSCGEERDRSSHIYKEEIITYPTCLKTGLKRLSCIVCDYTKEVVIEKTTHDYSQNFVFNEEKHYHECSICHDVIDEEIHNFDELIIDYPTCNAAGRKIVTCKICGYTKEVVIESKKHNIPKEWFFDDECHYYSCLDCGEVLTKENHDFILEYIEPTCENTGKKTIACTICGYQKTTVIPISEHSFDSEYSYNDDFHYHQCECGEVDNYEKHSFDDGVVTLAPSQNENGIIVYTCTICGYSKEKEIVYTKEKIETLNSSNLSTYDYIHFHNVKPNETYDNEFTIAMKNGYIESTNISEIQKIIVTVFGTYDNLVMYDSLKQEKVIKGTTEPSQEYENGLSYVYLFDNTNSFYLANQSNYNSNIYEISIYYTGTINTNIVIPDTKGSIDINTYTFNKLKMIEYSSAFINPSNVQELIIGPSGYIKSSDIGKIISIEAIDPSLDVSVYANSSELKRISWEYNIDIGKYIYNFNGETSFLIVNETDKDLSFTGFIITYETDSNETITISEALDIGSTLSSSKGITTSSYIISGMITEISGKEIIITDENGKTIIAYSEENIPNMYMNYHVQVEGKIQNYYGKIEIVEYSVIDYIPAFYQIVIDNTNNGLIKVSKEEEITYGEEVVISLTPDTGYKVLSVLVDGIKVPFDSNESSNTYTATIKVLYSIHVSAEFVTVGTIIEETVTNTYTISDYQAGVKYAIEEEHLLDNNITLTTSLCHFTSELRMYSSTTNNGIAIIKSKTIIKELVLNLGYSKDIMNVYGSIDGLQYELIGKINTVTSYKDYSLELTKDYLYLKLDVEGKNQIRIQSITLTTLKAEEEFIDVKEIQTRSEEITLQIGETYDLGIIIVPTNATNKELIFEFNDELIDISGNYIVTALLDGETIIDIYSYDKKISTSISVLIKKKEIIPTDEEFTIYNIEMMGTYGDSNLIKYGDYDILIDGGTSSDTTKIGKAISDRVTDHVIDLLVISHPDTDHYEGILSMVALSSVNEVKNVMTNGNGDNVRILNALQTKFPKANYCVITDYVSLNELVYTINVNEEFSIDFLYQDNYTNKSSNKNNQSIVMTLNYNDTIVFMAGDLEENGCNSVMKYHPNLTTEDDYVIFKALHHGSKYTNQTNFLNYMKPDICFISAGMKLTEPNYTPNYGSHPYIEAVSRLGAATPYVYWSGISGNIEIECIDDLVVVTGEGRSKDYYYYLKSSPKSYILSSREDEKNISFFESDFYRIAVENLGYPDYMNAYK